MVVIRANVTDAQLFAIIYYIKIKKALLVFFYSNKKNNS
jgi:hypothetical protein